MPLDQDDIDAILEAQAAEPAKAVVDGNSVENRPVKDLIALEDRIAAKAAIGTGGGWGAVCRSRVVLPASTGPREVPE